MKKSVVANLCKRTKHICLYNLPVRDCDDNETVSQWIGDGTSAYYMANLPHVDMDGLFAVLDIPQKDQEKYIFSQMAKPAAINFTDLDDDEIGAYRFGHFSFYFRGELLLPLMDDVGTIHFIQHKYLTPLADTSPVDLYMRFTPDGIPYVVAKMGMFCLAIISPYIAHANEECADELAQITRAVEMLATVQENRQSGEDDLQLQLEEGDAQ